MAYLSEKGHVKECRLSFRAAVKVFLNWLLVINVNSDAALGVPGFDRGEERHGDLSKRTVA